VSDVTDQIVEIKSRDYWFKIVEMLQQNWALVDELRDGSCMVFFMHDASGVFDQMEFQSKQEAFRQLKNNGFSRFDEDKEVCQFIAPPKPPFRIDAHPKGAIYSSGRYWQR
jgi:hypothetical protein